MWRVLTISIWLCRSAVGAAILGVPGECIQGAGWTDLVEICEALWEREDHKVIRDLREIRVIKVQLVTKV